MEYLKGVGIGAGYFSKYQYEAWSRMSDVEIAALCNRKVEKGKALMKEYNIPRHYTDYREMINAEKPDFVDVITPPDTHLEMCRFAAERGVDVLCQKPLAPTIEEAIDESVHNNPQQIAQAIFPILGPAIRKAIAETMAGFVSTLNKAIEHSLSLRGLTKRFAGQVVAVVDTVLDNENQEEVLRAQLGTISAKIAQLAAQLICNQ